MFHKLPTLHGSKSEEMEDGISPNAVTDIRRPTISVDSGDDAPRVNEIKLIWREREWVVQIVGLG
jgi:hypothetical protein